MKILLLGKDGQVGNALKAELQKVGDVVAYGRQQADFLDPQGLVTLILEEAPDVVVNAAAYTAVDKAEDNPQQAEAVNAIAVAAIARAAKECGAWLIHFSSDYVYDGKKQQPYLEQDQTNPLSVYGKTKLAGDKAIIAENRKYIILRTSWVYGERGQNFASTILALAAHREELRIVVDQNGAPCSAKLLAEVVGQIIGRLGNGANLSGVYHIAPAGQTSWYEYARFLIEEAKKYAPHLAVRCVIPVTTAEYGAKASRPANSLLDCRKIETTFGLILPPWQEGVREFVQACFGGNNNEKP